MAKKKIEDKFRKLTDIEHVLHRPFMYIGSTSMHTGNTYVYNVEDNSINLSEVTYNPGFLKIFDEIISNSIDEHRDNGEISEIKVTIDTVKNEISVYDNGGIPVVMHKKEKQWVPELIFSNLKAGSNFNDDEARNKSGTNGVGSTLTNIYSTRFTVKTCDGKNKFEQVYSNNMYKRTKAKVSKSNKGFTEIKYSPDFSRFDMQGISKVDTQLIIKRCIDAAGCNPKLKVRVRVISENSKDLYVFKLKKFSDYIKYYNLSDYYYEESNDWRIGIAESHDGFRQMSFVNSVLTKDGGTHVEYIANQVISKLRELIKKKHKIQVKPSDIRNHLYIFIDSHIVNPALSPQTKDELISEVRDFGTSHDVSDTLVKQIFKSDIIKTILEWIENKKLIEERANLKRLNKSLDKTKVLKLIDAQKKGDRSKCILGIYEGLSALSAVRKFRDTQYIGAFPLKGKFLNVHEVPNSKIIANDEAVGLMAALGLKLGHSPKNLRYGKVYIYTDADPDGNHIAASLINFFAKFWPELFKDRKIFKVMTPIVVAKYGKQSLNFYDIATFTVWKNKSSRSKWDIEYKKGLAALEDSEYEDIIKNPNLISILYDKDSTNSLYSWFGKDSAPRKEKILNNKI